MRRHEKHISGRVGDLIRAKRLKAGLTREQLSKVSGIPIYWLGRWERHRSLPDAAEWNNLSTVLTLPARPKTI